MEGFLIYDLNCENQSQGLLWLTCLVLSLSPPAGEPHHLHPQSHFYFILFHSHTHLPLPLSTIHQDKIHINVTTFMEMLFFYLFLI